MGEEMRGGGVDGGELGWVQEEVEWVEEEGVGAGGSRWVWEGSPDSLFSLSCHFCLLCYMGRAAS